MHGMFPGILTGEGLRLDSRLHRENVQPTGKWNRINNEMERYAFIAVTGFRKIMKLLGGSVRLNSFPKKVIIKACGVLQEVVSESRFLNKRLSETFYS